MSTTVIDRDRAVGRIADAIADRTAFVVAVPPPAVGDVADRLGTVPGWTAYLDSGLPAILTTGERPVIALANLFGEVAADGSQDMLIIHGGHGSLMAWPILLVDAIAAVNPAVAAQIRANDVRSMS